MKANHIIIVPETHWDREWYLPFQEYRARLVILMDKLLDILKNDQDYTNFTLDGQTIPLEDYLEVRPNRKEKLKKYVSEGRLSIGPMYILPDEFLVSGESTIRNLLIGHQISRKFGRVMKVGYIPDPFGHIAQLPQILSGFELPAVLFWRGFGNEFEENNLNMEFKWNAPGNAASIIAIHLILSYSSIADIRMSKKDGKYKSALHKMKRTIKKFERYTATPFVLLNSGTDHHEARAEIPEIVSQWNELFPDQKMEQSDFEYYINKILSYNPKLKSFQGELRGGKYAHLLSGVLSARMWIKQRNTEIEYLYEKYTEPLSTITWILDKDEEYEYPKAYILVGLKWLLRNSPHDSICGCSIDQVHREMATRFDWAEQIGNEIVKDAIIHLSSLIKFKEVNNYVPFIVFNPLPWRRTDIVQFNNIVNPKMFGSKLKGLFKVIDSDDTEISYQYLPIKENPRYTQVEGKSYLYTFLADIPACGYKVFYIVPNETMTEPPISTDTFSMKFRGLENQFYLIKVSLQGIISIYDKKGGNWYENVCYFEDVGDWGDEYDFSGPNENQTDLKFTTEDLNILEILPYIDGPTQKTLVIRGNLNLPASLTEDRYSRENYLLSNPINIYISLYNNIKRIDFKIELDNNSKDHRIRVLFPSKLITNTVKCDGHFYVISRDIDLPIAENWAQRPLPTNHQKDFISVTDEKTTFAVLNKGLPEYEAIKNDDNTLTLAITLLRSVEWLSRHDFATRKSNAGPDLNTPEAQCLGKHTFNLSVVIEDKSNWIEAAIHKRGKEFNNPLKLIFPSMARSSLRVSDRVILIPFGIISYETVFVSGTRKLELETFLPTELSFLEIDNAKVILSALKKSEEEDYVIIRVYNISPESQTTEFKFYEKLHIFEAKIVNLLEEAPINPIKASINFLQDNIINITINPHVIATLKLKFKKKI